MGGAFVGLADDFSAVFWNPAGLAHIKQKYIAFYGFDIIPSMNYKLETPIPGVGADAQAVTKHYLGGLAGYFQPVSENLVLGLAVYSPSGLGIEWDGQDLAGISGPPGSPSRREQSVRPEHRSVDRRIPGALWLRVSVHPRAAGMPALRKEECS